MLNVKNVKKKLNTLAIGIQRSTLKMNPVQGMMLCLMVAAMAVFFISPEASADTASVATQILTIVKNIFAIVCFVFGGIRLLSGITKFASATDDDPQADRKATSTLTSAVILLAMGAVLMVFKIAWIVNLISDAGNNIGNGGAGA